MSDNEKSECGRDEYELTEDGWIHCHVLCFNRKEEDLGVVNSDVWLPFSFRSSAVMAYKATGEDADGQSEDRTTMYLGDATEAFIVNLDYQTFRKMREMVALLK